MPHEMSPGKPTTRRYTDAEKERAVRMVRQLGRELGTEHGTVKRVADQLGVGVGLTPSSISACFTQLRTDSSCSTSTAGPTVTPSPRRSSNGSKPGTTRADDTATAPCSAPSITKPPTRHDHPTPTPSVEPGEAHYPHMNSPRFSDATHWVTMTSATQNRSRTSTPARRSPDRRIGTTRQATCRPVLLRGVGQSGFRPSYLSSPQPTDGIEVIPEPGQEDRP